MSKVLVSESNLTDIADSIRSKLGVNTLYMPGQMSDAIDSIETGGGLEINGVIKAYPAKGTIDAGDFVTYVNEYGTGNDETLSTAVNSGTAMSAVALSEGKVFIAYPSGSEKYLYGVVCTINGTTITPGTPTIINSSGYNLGETVCTVALNSSKVVVIHSAAHSTGTRPPIAGVVCTISGTTITAGQDTTLVSSRFGNVFSAVVLTSSKIFLAYNAGSSSSDYWLHTMLCTISDTTITVSTIFDPDLGSTAGAVFSAVALSSSKVFISHCSDNSSYYLKGIVLTISGTSISKGSDTYLSTNEQYCNVISAVPLSSTRVIIINSYNNNEYLRATVCTISGTSISYTHNYLGSRFQRNSTLSIVAISDKYVFLTCPYNNRLIGYMLEVYSSNTVSQLSESYLSTEYGSGSVISSTLLSQNNIFVAHASDSTNFNLNGIIVTQKVKKVTSSTNTILGVANTSGSDYTFVDVWVPQV